MARRIKSTKLDSPTAREALPRRTKPYYVPIDREVHLGYRKGKRGGVWVLRSYAGDGRYEVETFAKADDNSPEDGDTVLDFWQAQEQARKRHQKKRRRAIGLPESKGPYTVTGCMADYLESLHDNATASTVVDTDRRIKALIEPTLGRIECAKLTTKQIKDWHRAVAKQPPRLRTRDGAKQNYREINLEDQEVARRRKASANRTLTVLKAALNRAWESGQIQSDEQWRRVKPFKNVEAARVRYLRVDEARRLLNACEPDLRDLVQGGLATGARYGELCALNVDDFDPDNGTIHIRQSKSGKARHVFLTDEGLRLFNGLTAGRPGDSPIFRKADGGRWLKSHQGRPFSAAVERAKIKPPISFHGLRHTFASLAIMNGCPLMVVAENLGHADTRMVEKHYGHLSREHVAEAIRAAAPRFGVDQPSNIAPMTRG
jgi:integrase